MQQKKPSEMSLWELMSHLGNAHPGSIARPPFEAEYERRKFVLQRWAVVITGLGLVVASLGLLFGVALFAGILETVSLPQTQNGWRGTANRVMLLPDG